MSIKKNGGIFGRNPTYYNVEVENDLRVGGDLIINGETVTGLDFEGSWDASTNTPDVTASPTVGQFWIVSVAGSTDLSGITTWDVGDWALYDGSAWQRVEGGGNGTFTKVNVDNLQLDGNTISSTDTNGNIAITPDGTGSVVISKADVNGGTIDGVTIGGSSAGNITGNELTVNLSAGYGSILIYGSSTTRSDTIAGVDVKADAYRKAGFRVLDQGNNEDWFIGRPYASTNQFLISNDGAARLSINSSATTTLHGFLVTNTGATINQDGADSDFRVESDNNANMLFVDAGNDRVGIGTSSPGATLDVSGAVKSSTVYTEAGSIYIANGATETIFGIGSSFNSRRVYLLTAMGQTGNAQYRLAAIIFGGDSIASGGPHLITLGNALISASFSGNNLQITNSGGSTTIAWRLVRLMA